MANSLFKKEVIIRENSTITVKDAITWTKNWLNKFQDKDTNKDSNGNYINYFFADTFDSRTGNLYRVFTDASKKKFNMKNTVFELLITSNFIPSSNISNNIDLGKDEDFLITRSGVRNVMDNALDNFVSTAAIVNEADVIKDDKIKLSNIPSGGIIGGTCNIKINDNGVFDEVSCTVDSNILTIEPNIKGEYDGKVCIVSYLVSKNGRA